MTGGIDMKQEMPSTFILNINDKQYFYVEGKHSRLHGPVYHVYYSKDEKPIFYRAENFVEVHGLDEKQRISTFTHQALLNLRILIGTSEKAEETYNKFYDIYVKVKDGNDKKPILKNSSKLSFIEAIDNYNEIKDSLRQEIPIPFEENYRLVNPEYQEREKVLARTNYENSVEEDINEKGLQRVLKKAA